MRILFLHSGMELTGSGTYALALEEAWKGRHDIFWAGDRAIGTPVPEHFLRVPLSEKLLPRGLMNVRPIIDFVRSRKIDVIHAHSRRANCIAAMASYCTGVPYVTTSHLRMRPHLWNRLLGFWGDRTIAICDTIAAHLRDANHVPPEKIVFLRNGINLEHFAPMPAKTQHGPRLISVIGRLSGHRWRAAAFILSIAPEIFRQFPDAHLRFIGALNPVHAAEFNARIAFFNRPGQAPQVSHIGFVQDVRPFIAESRVVLAAGRSLLEALAMEIPGISIGEEGAHGLLTPENFDRARTTNFGDFAAGQKGTYSDHVILKGLQHVLTTDDVALRRWGRSRLSPDYNGVEVARGVEHVYNDVMRGLHRQPNRVRTLSSKSIAGFVK